jgi:hypothetical protein
MLKNTAPVLLTLIMVLLFSAANAQNNKTGTWGIATVVLPGDSTHHWGGYIELQARANTLFNQFFYYETKGGVSYDIAKNYTALIGTGRYVTYDYNNLAKTFFVSVFDEIFLNNVAPHFERNRFSAAFGYQFDKSLSVQAGWLDQYNYNLTTAGAKNNLAITVMYRINRKNTKPKEHIPTTVD